MEKKTRAIIIAIIVIGASAGVLIWAFTSVESPRDKIDGHLNVIFAAQKPGDLEGIFDPVVTEAISLEDLFANIQEIFQYYGTFRSVRTADYAGYGAYYYNLSLSISAGRGIASLNEQTGQLNGFFIQNFVFNETYLAGATWDDLYAEYDMLPGTKALVIQVGSTGFMRATGQAQRLAVGSTFKLFVLDALATKINADPAISWETRLAIREDWKSLPSGILQNEKAGTEYTLADLANYMIKISDNTATDHLIHYLGRTYVESFLPSGYSHLPLLTTGESFKLRWQLSDADLTSYLGMDVPARRTYLDTTVDFLNISHINVSAIDWDHNYDNRIQTEWFFNATEIVSALQETQDLSATHMNPGLADPRDWGQVAFKGGSDTGVLSYAHALQATNGTWFYLVAISNTGTTFRMDLGQYVDGMTGFTATLQKIIGKLAIEMN